MLLEPANAAGFFRLRAASNTPPAFHDFAAPTQLGFGSNAPVTLSFLDPDADIVALEYVRSNELGLVTRSVPAAYVNLTGVNGQTILNLEAQRLAFGTNSFTFWLKDREGQLSGPTSFAVVVGANDGGGSAPVLSGLNFGGFAVRRPTGPADTFTLPARFNFSDANGDIERLRVVVTEPLGQVRGLEFSADSLGVAGNSGSFVGPLLTFHSTNQLGTYYLEFRLIDHHGNLSAPGYASVELSGGGGYEALSFGFANPSSAPAGSEVMLFCTGMTFFNALTNHVSLGGLPVPVISAGVNTLLVQIPSNAMAGFFRIESTDGVGTRVAYSASQFLVPERLHISPEAGEVVVGQQQQFEAGIFAAGERTLIWSVNGIDGGNTNVGTISPQGLFRAPSEIPTNGLVTLAARLAANPLVNTQVVVRILPPPAVPGRMKVLKAVGGLVRSKEGRASVAIPQDALSESQDIVVTTLIGTNKPAPPPGLVVLGGARFEPAGLTFSTPASITLPLSQARPPGTLLSVRLYNRTNDSYLDEGVLATVNAGGDTATAEVSHFSEYVAVYTSLASPPPPVVAAASPTNAQEGLVVPVYFTGSNLLPGAEVEVLLAGLPTTDILPGAFFGMTNSGGVLLQIQSITNLPAGQSNSYTLRVGNPAGPYAEWPFVVQGLDEFSVAAGQTLQLTNPLPKRYSELFIASNAVVNVVTGHFNVEVTGGVTIEGALLAEGIAGSPGAGLLGGSGASAFGPGGNGGRARQDYGCEMYLNDIFASLFGSPTPYDCAPYASYGMPASLTLSAVDRAYGFGGAPGESASLTFYDKFRSALGCVGGNVLSCYSAVAGIVQLTDTISDINAGEPLGCYGENGVPAQFSGGFGSGGGGGGGGGALRLDFDFLDGGPGGGGGSGGKPISIASAAAMHINGRVSSMGGAGGHGAPSADLLNFPFPLPNSLEEFLGGAIRGFGGGGGGGGSGGELVLIAGQGIARGPDGVYTSQGGAAGLRMLAEIEGNQIGLRRPGFDRAPNGYLRVTEPDRAHVLGGPSFARSNVVFAAETKVTVTRVIRAYLRNGTTLRVIHNGVTNEVSGIPTATSTYPIPPYVATTTLQPGLSTLLMPGMHELLHKQVLYLPGADADSDGLGDPDEALLGTNPNLSDTDDDGRSDLEEVLANHDPLDPDMDDDGVWDGLEVTRGTDPRKMDTDGDGLLDGAEHILGTSGLISNAPPIDLTGLLFVHTTTASNSHWLALLNPTNGQLGLVGKPNQGETFGISFSHQPLPTLHFAQLQTFTKASQNPLLADANGMIPNSVLGALGGGIKGLKLTARRTDGLFYAVATSDTPPYAPTGQLLSLHPTPGLATPLGSPGPIIQALTANCDGDLYASMLISGTNRLVRLNATNGTVTQDIGPLPFDSISGLVFGRDGTLYGTALLASNDSRLVTINPTSGATTVISSVARGLYDLALAPCATPCFSAITTNQMFDGGDAPTDVRLADLNHDGHQDLVLAVRHPNQIGVMLGDGTGNFGAMSTYLATTGDVYCSFVVLGHLNADTNLDAIVTCYQDPDLEDSPRFGILLGDGLGGFGPPMTYLVGTGFGDNPGEPVIADLNEDGFNDVVVPLRDSDEILVYTNNMSGIMGLRGAFTSGDGESGPMLLPMRAAVGDVNHDSHLDIVTANEAGYWVEDGPHVSVFLGDGTGNLTNSINYSLTNIMTGPSYITGDIALVDLNSDSHLDIAVIAGIAIQTAPSSLHVLLGAGSGAFAPPIRYALPVQANGPEMVVVDFNQDGWLDIAASEEYSDFTENGTLAFLIGTGTGGFVPGANYTHPGIAGLRYSGIIRGLTAGDINHDGRIDVIATSPGGSPADRPPTDNVSVFLAAPPCD
ncbi:MAG: FG-GAP-like repeat-containing protein [Verrucomicrobiota bacterium]